MQKEIKINKSTFQVPFSLQNLVNLLLLLVVHLFIYGCTSSSGSEGGYMPATPSLPVIAVSTMEATTYQDYSASLEGSKDIEIRPQVEGYLEKIYVDEGAYVRKGQVLFVINDRPYREQLNNARASLAAARANLTQSGINVSRLTPLVQNNVVSEVQLKTARAAEDAARANVAQAEAMVQSAQINLGYTSIKAPVDGYIGRIPFKTGSLVGTGTLQPLTVLSEIKEIHAYFSLSEKEFMEFKNQFSGNSVEAKIKQMPPVELVLADGSNYGEKGKVEIVSGQFNNTMGAISFRASFKNKDGLLRSGNTGKVRIPQVVSNAVVVPQEASFEMQDKVFVFTVSDSNKVVSTPLIISGKKGNYYLVKAGLMPGQKIVFSGHDRLQDGALIQPETISMDSLLKVNPL